MPSPTISSRTPCQAEVIECLFRKLWTSFTNILSLCVVWACSDEHTHCGPYIDQGQLYSRVLAFWKGIEIFSCWTANYVPCFYLSWQALMAMPAPDFSLCLFLIPEQVVCIIFLFVLLCGTFACMLEECSIDICQKYAITFSYPLSSLFFFPISKWRSSSKHWLFSLTIWRYLSMLVQNSILVK